LGRLPVPDAVGDDDEVRPRVERAPFFEEDVREVVVQKLLRRAARAVEDEHGLARGIADGDVVNPHLGEGLAALEVEVADDEVVLDGKEEGQGEEKVLHTWPSCQIAITSVPSRSSNTPRSGCASAASRRSSGTARATPGPATWTRTPPCTWRSCASTATGA